MFCEYYDSCGFMRNMDRSDPLTAETVKITYCGDDKYGCARYGLFQVMATDEVPDFIWPNDEEEALEVMKTVSRQRDKSRQDKTV